MRGKKSAKLANIWEEYSITNIKKFDTSNDTPKNMLWKQFLAWHCNGYSAAQISDYINKPIFQELPLEKDYFKDDSDERIYVDLRYSLGYPSEVEKPSRNDSKLTLTIELKSVLPKKNDAQSLKICSQRVSCRWQADIKMQNLHNKISIPCTWKMKRTYLKRGIWHLEGRKKQKGGFLPIIGKIARPLLVSVAGAISSKLLEGVGRKIFGGRKKRWISRRWKHLTYA